MTRRTKRAAAAVVTYAQIELAMRERYPASSHALLWEVANATGAGVRRHADAVVVGLWPSHGHAISGFELKMSRSDWLRERAQPQKSAPVYRYCHHWWLLAPKGLVSTDELPPTWGLLEVDERGASRAKVRAPRLEPVPADMGFVAALLRARARPDEKATEKLVADRVEKATSDLEARVRREVEGRFTDREKLLERAEEMVRAIKDHTGLDLVHWSVTEKDIRRRIEIASALSAGYDPPLTALRYAAKKALEAVDALMGNAGE